jgi:hypothetical protein
MIESQPTGFIMKRHIASVLLCIGLAACATANPPQVARQPAQPALASAMTNDAHTAAVRRMLIAWDYYAQFMNGVRQGASRNNNSPQERAYAACVLGQFNTESVLNLVLPAYRRHFTQTEAEMVAEFFESPNGQAVRKKDLQHLMKITSEAELRQIATVMGRLNKQRVTRIEQELEQAALTAGIRAGIPCLKHLESKPSRAGAGI